MTTTPSQCDLILEALRAAAGEWVSMPQLAAAGESLNVHSRIDELRTKRGLSIENKLCADPVKPRRRQSFYRLIK
jgi:hypothetical protein